MAELTPEEEKKKRDLFEAMSPRSQKRILKKGYEEWDPFMLPKEPLAYKLKQEAKGEKVTLDSGHELHERYFSEHSFPITHPSMSRESWRYRRVFSAVKIATRVCMISVVGTKSGVNSMKRKNSCGFGDYCARLLL